MTSVEQLAFELVLEQIEHGPPVHAGGLHPDHRHRVAAQPVRQRQQPRRGGGELEDLLPAAAGTVRDAHARGDLGLVDVEHRAPLDQTIHQPSQGSEDTKTARESLIRWSLNHVLDGNSSGCPRLSRPTDNRAQRHQAEPTSTKAINEIAAAQRHRRQRRTNIFIPSGWAPPGAHESLICTFELGVLGGVIGHAPSFVTWGDAFAPIDENPSALRTAGSGHQGTVRLTSKNARPDQSGPISAIRTMIGGAVLERPVCWAIVEVGGSVTRDRPAIRQAQRDVRLHGGETQARIGVTVCHAASGVVIEVGRPETGARRGGLSA